MADVPCSLLRWDSEFFGFRVGRITTPRLGREDARAVVEWARRESVQCVYYLADVADLDSVQAASAAGFELVDVRVELENLLEGNSSALPPADPTVSIESCVPEDVPRLARLARRLHRNTRFFTDQRFAEARSEDLYERWISDSCAGSADVVLVARREGSATGYISCHLEPDGRGRIGLVGVAEEVQHRGVGRRLVGSAMDWFRNQGVERVNVATQGNRVAAIRLYERGGFVIHALRVWLHLWV